MVRTNLKLTKIERLDKTVYLFSYLADQLIEWVPGQYATLLLGEKLRRPYTILDYDSKNHTVKFLIDIAPGGEASKYFSKTKVGDEIEGFFSLGDFRYIPSKRKCCMIATGTGIAPLIPIIDQCCVSDGFKATVLWGVRSSESNYFDKLIDAKTYSEVIRCVSSALGPGDYFQGRVTKYITDVFSKSVNMKEYDYYLCGRTSIVQDIGGLLVELGVPREQIFSERY